MVRATNGWLRKTDKRIRGLPSVYPLKSAGHCPKCEITALEAKLSKAREVKAGMMSVLLGGKIRLNHD